MDSRGTFQELRKAGRAMHDFLRNGAPDEMAQTYHTANNSHKEKGDAMNEMLLHYQMQQSAPDSRTESPNADCESGTLGSVSENFGMCQQRLAPFVDANPPENSSNISISASRAATVSDASYLSAKNSSDNYLTCENCSASMDSETAQSSHNVLNSDREVEQPAVKLRKRRKSSQELDEAVLRRKDLTSLCSTADATELATSSQENLAESVSSEDEELRRYFRGLPRQPESHSSREFTCLAAMLTRSCVRTCMCPHCF